MSKKRVLGVIGLGHVGAHVAYSLAIQGIADELVLVDKNEQKLASEVQDLRDAAAYLPHRVTVRAGCASFAQKYAAGSRLPDSGRRSARIWAFFQAFIRASS